MNKSLLLLILLLVIGGGLYLLNSKKPQEEIFTCTMDALICPDGSGVGRTGLECKFNACEYTGPYVGTLMEEDGGYGLLMPHPDGGGDVNYVLPLEIKVTNALKDMVGKKVSVTGSFIEGNLLQVENVEEMQMDTQTSASIKIDETKTINGLKITLNGVPGDYRCPKDVQCIQAGAITANITLESSTKKETKNMASDEVPMSFENYKISIIGVAPDLISTVPVNPKSYVVTFKVEKP